MWKPSEFRATEQGLTVSTLGAALMYKSHTVFSGVLLANVHLCVYTHMRAHTQSEWGMHLCRVHICFFSISLVTLIRLMCPSTPTALGCYYVWASCVPGAERLLPGKPIWHAQTNLNPGCEPSLGLSWDIPPLTLHAELILKPDGKVRSPTRKL